MFENEILNKKLAYFAGKSYDETLSLLKTNSGGLSHTEAESRLEQFGRNTLKEEVKLHIALQYLSNFKNPLILILLIVAVISLLTHGTTEAIIILFLVFMSVTLNFFQEYKANNAARDLKSRIANLAVVLRDGKKLNINTADICVGDILEFSAGDLIPADCRVMNSKDFFINQSSLTGESFPVEKFDFPVTQQDPDLNQLTNILFHGTSVVTGSAKGIVLKTGSATEYGKIALNLSKKEDTNEFTKGISDFSILILKVVIFFVLFIFLVNSILKQNVLESLLFSVAVAVGLTPEFLPMIMSVTMGKGSLNMAKKGVIVKKLTAIPSFGSIDVLCTDKTGTLTEDKIKLVSYTDLKGKHSEKVLLNAYLNSMYQTGINNPMDDAVINYRKIDIGSYAKKDEIPFDFNRKCVSIVAESPVEGVMMITKGAPEELFKHCKYYDEGGKKEILNPDKADALIKQ
jgi:Mg2+-importing ATPase